MGVLQEKLHQAKTRTEHRIGIKDELELLEVCASYTRYKIWEMGEGYYCNRRDLALVLTLEPFFYIFGYLFVFVHIMSHLARYLYAGLCPCFRALSCHGCF